MIHADLLNEHYNGWTRFLQESESWSADHIIEYQLSELRRIILYAYNKTDGYYKLYNTTEVPPLSTLSDVGFLPFVTKEMIRDRCQEFTVPGQNWTYVTTGGSTGIPCGFYRDAAALPKELASKAHQYRRIGWKEGDRQIVFRGLPIDTVDGMLFVPEFNELRCSTYQFYPERMEGFRQRALEYQPEWIRCYPSSGFLFAKFLRETGRIFPPVKGVLCASEQLYDFQKKLMSEVFQARIFSHYGHYELAVLAGFCEHEDAYHVLPQYGYAELIGADGMPVQTPGAIGEVVATSFIMRATPLIRYRTQDYAVFKSFGCAACGRPYQVWERIEGRLQEFIRTKTGRNFSTAMLNMHDDFYDRLVEFQYVQKEPGTLIFRYIPKSGFDAVAASQKLRARCSDDVDIVMEEVQAIPLTPRGKRSLLVQELKLGLEMPA